MITENKDEITIYDVISKKKEVSKKADTKLIMKAYNLAAEKHKDQKRHKTKKGGCSRGGSLFSSVHKRHKTNKRRVCSRRKRIVFVHKRHRKTQKGTKRQKEKSARGGSAIIVSAVLAQWVFWRCRPKKRTRGIQSHLSFGRVETMLPS